MKTIELELKKKLFIVEFEDNNHREGIIGLKDLKMEWYNGEEIKLICKGSELTEEIAKGLVKNEISDYLVEWAYDYKNEEKLNLDTFSCLESFISAIEAQGYYWGSFPSEKISWTEINKWQEAKSKTFDLNKTLIFEIL